MSARLRFAFAFLLLAPPAAAQWAPTSGPAGATFHQLAATDGGVVLGSSSFGPLFRFAGDSWARLEIDPVRDVLASGSDVYVTDATDLHVSSDAGASFSSVPLAPNVQLLSIDGDNLFALRADTLMASDDGGVTWTRHHDNAWVTVSLPGQPPSSFSVNLGGFKAAVVEGDAVLAAATAYIFGDVYRLAPGDTAWTPLVFRETTFADARFIGDLVRFAGSLFVASDAGVHVSVDGGETWQDRSQGINPADLTFGGDLLPGAGALYGQFGNAFYRLDGPTWTPLPQPPGGFALGYDAGDRIYASMLDVVLGLGAAGWEELPRPIASSPVLAHAAGETVLAIAGGRLHRTDNAGATWSALPLQSISGSVHSGPSALLAAVATPSGIARSVDSGQTWTAATRPGTPGSVGSIVPRRFASDAAASYASYSYQRFGDHGEPLEQYGGVFRTADGGHSWTNVSAGLPTAPLGPWPIGALFSDGTALLTQAGNGACYRRDTGPWLSIACPGGTIERFVAHGGQWFAVSASGAFVSADRGATWAPASSGVVLPPNPNEHAQFWRLTHLVSTPTGVLLIDTYGDEARAYRFDGTWQSLELIFPESVRWTGFASGSDALFGGARDAGVWSVPLDVITSPSQAPPPGATLALSAPTPNPASRTVTVDLTVARSSDATVSVFDALGRRVAALHDGRLPAGVHALVIDANSLRPGVYLIRATTPAGSATRSLTVVR